MIEEIDLVNWKMRGAFWIENQSRRSFQTVAVDSARAILEQCSKLTGCWIQAMIMSLQLSHGTYRGSDSFEGLKILPSMNPNCCEQVWNERIGSAFTWLNVIRTCRMMRIGVEVEIGVVSHVGI